MNKPALLVLEDSSIFQGFSIGADGMSAGEVVFNTAITGYQEILTDPSYARQLVTLTYPHIGNTGTNDEDEESRGVFCSGLVVKNVPHRHSSWRSQYSLRTYLENKGVVGISDIDTRKLTRLLRTKGAQRGCIVAGDDMDIEKAVQKAKAFPGLAGMDLAKEVTISSKFEWQGGVWNLEHGYQTIASPNFHIVAYDFGIKHNILRLLSDRGCKVTVVPAQTSADDVLKLSPHGIFLSNGPGDPEPCDYAINAIKKFLDIEIPIFGICLGHQLMCLASGAKTSKMKFGHHGANHPVQNLDTGQVFITSQNHGFTVDEDQLGDNLRVTHRSLFDGTVQGVERVDKPAFSFQGHPEASPGPKDINGLFDRFIQLLEVTSGDRVDA